MTNRPSAAVACLLSAVLAGCGERYNYMTYQEFILNGPTTVKLNRMYPRTPDGIPNLFVKTPDGGVFTFRDLPEAVVKKLDGVRHTSQLGVDQYSCGETVLQYQKGKLLTFTFGEGSLKIGAERNGPFQSFPMTRDDVYGTFGEPEREGRASTPQFEWK